MTDVRTNEPAPGGAFDDKLGRLEEIVGELEQGGLGLEPAIERYQEGLALLKDCHRALETYKKRVEELTREAEAAMRPFEGDPDLPGEASGEEPHRGARVSAPRWLEEGRAWAERLLEDALPGEGEPPEQLHAAMRYALLGGGKRLRPALLRLVCLELGGSDERAERAAVALELVHTYSLVHDDLPAMDDDELRRGRPTVHVAFDEATAILVGDALLTLAFEVLSEDEPPRAREHARVLARAAGSRGMVGGQLLDLSLEARGQAGLEALADMHRRKTAGLFAAAAEMGAIAAGRDARVRALAAGYGEAVGRLFQAVDDLLDVTGDAATLGKTPGKDAALARATLVRALGLAGARAEAAGLASAAHARALALGFGPGTAPHELVDFVLARRA